MTSPAAAPTEARYARQVLVEEIGREGQQKLAQARLVVVGVGALGGIQADLFARAGVGEIHVVDRDVVDVTNLQRQTLYDEGDVGRPKAEAAAARLRRVNSSIKVVPHASDFDAALGKRLVPGASALVDGTDNLSTRFLMNDLSVANGVPWTYAAAVATYGMVFACDPAGPCFECVFPTEPPRGALATCDTVGVLNTLTTAVGAFAANLTMWRLLGRPPDPVLHSFDMRGISVEAMPVVKRSDCPACVGRKFEHLSGRTDEFVELCGRNVLQVRPRKGASVEMFALEARLRKSVPVRRIDSVLRFTAEGHDVVVFEDGRALIHGTEDPARAKAIYSRYIG
jgi:molybdopterin/thiamine biosynthesis adenylyltransferase